MHVLFHLDKEEKLHNTISDEAIEAAIDFVEVCCQHTAYITGRGSIQEELDHLQSEHMKGHFILRPRRLSIYEKSSSVAIPHAGLN